jgi:F0F1-type ATP synthase membrane subunit b/b'
MFAIINFVSILVVTAAVAYHYFVFFDTKKKAEVALDVAKAQAKADVAAAKKEGEQRLTSTKAALTSNLSNVRKEANNGISRAQTTLTNSINQTKSTLDLQFKNLSEQVTTKKLNVSGDMKASKVRLGDKWVLSGTGDGHANDSWLRVLNDKNAYHGGIAMGSLWVQDTSTLNGVVNAGGNMNVKGNMTIKGGKSEHNPNNWQTHFPNGPDGKNYIRGDTEIRGNTNNIGNMKVNRNFCVEDVCINKEDLAKMKQKLV